MKLRLFVGISAPEEWKFALKEWRGRIQSRFSNSFGRWTSEANLHLTLRFFGSVEDAKVAAICEALREISERTQKFAVSPGNLGCFPNLSRPRIVWLGLGGATERLSELESRVRSATTGFGQPPEDRPFHPHLTLARLKEPTRDDRAEIAELIHKQEPVQAENWKICSFELIRSDTGSDGSVYTHLANFPLVSEGL